MAWIFRSLAILCTRYRLDIYFCFNHGRLLPIVPPWSDVVDVSRNFVSQRFLLVTLGQSIPTCVKEPALSTSRILGRIRLIYQ